MTEIVEAPALDRVVVTRSFIGLLFMQVCAVPDATDEEILEVCNRLNPAGTTNGWGGVIRSLDQRDWIRENQLPLRCEEHPDRLHFLVWC